ncbi:MAG: hypothetical protein EBS42_15330, partial [Caulobacteraceae bacterium]|nr:hypothetical protein [Caulobacteraceae bacterium]
MAGGGGGEDGDFGFQIAPMVDVVFVLMLFFMACAGAQQVELEMKIKLPAGQGSVESKVTPILIDISSDGLVSMNNQTYGQPTDRNLESLREWLKNAIETFGDKAAARALAARVGVPLLEGTGPIDAAGAARFLAEHGAMMLKAVAGGGGRGMRIVRKGEDVAAAHAACAREATAAFGDDGVYAEWLVDRARHIEVQVAGDGASCVAVGERDCSVQRRHQKIIEIAPAPGLSDRLREALHEAAVKLCAARHLRSLATVEFLVDAVSGRFAFIETNARLQVEHTVTEEVTGVDLVRAQIEL